jgi:hypothetical protein
MLHLALSAYLRRIMTVTWRFCAVDGPRGNNELVMLGPSLHSFHARLLKWVGGKPHRKCAAETPKRSHLATTVLAGGKLKFYAQLVTTGTLASERRFMPGTSFSITEKSSSSLIGFVT